MGWNGMGHAGMSGMGEITRLNGLEGMCVCVA